MIPLDIMCYDSTNTENMLSLDIKQDIHQHESSNISTTFSDHSSDLSPSPQLNNQVEIEVGHSYDFSHEQDNQMIEITSKISTILQEILKFQISMDKNGTRFGKNVCFNNTCIPSISLNEYLNNIMINAKLEKDICILGLYYVDRLIRLQPTFCITELNCHRLILASIMIASKMHQDIQTYHYPVKLFALIGGVCESELFVMEQAFLNLLNYKHFIDEEEYTNYKKQLISLTI